MKLIASNNVKVRNCNTNFGTIMKRLLITIILIAFYASPKMLAGPFMDFGVSVGLSVPNDRVADILNTDRITESDFVGNLYRDGLDNGYTFGARIRLDLASSLKFVGAVSWNRFPQTDIEVRDPDTDELLATLKTTINIVPLNAGVNWYIIDRGIGLYAIADLSYNYITSSIDILREGEDFSIPIESSEVENTIGYGLGAGIDFNIMLARLNLEAKYNRLNIISFEENSKAKDYVTVTVGIYF